MFTSRAIGLNREKADDTDEGGKRIHYMYCDGTDDRITIGRTSTTMDWGVGSEDSDFFSVCFWIKMLEAQFYGMSCYAGSSYSYVRISQGSGDPSVYIPWKTTTQYSSSSTSCDWKVDGWNHIVVSRNVDLSKTVVYINGVKMNASTDNGTINLSFGLTFTPLFYFLLPSIAEFYQEGYAGELASYDKALSDSEAREIYNEGCIYDHKNGVAQTNLKQWIRFGKDTTVDEEDDIISGENFNKQGAPVFGVDYLP